MKAISAWGRRGTIHEWLPTAVTDYFQAKCRARAQLHRSDLQAGEHDLKGMPLCKHCFPSTVSVPQEQR